MESGMSLKQRPRATRAELARRIGVIRSNMETLLRVFPAHAEFQNEFSSFVTDLNELAGENDRGWVLDEVRLILTEYGAGELPNDH